MGFFSTIAKATKTSAKTTTKTGKSNNTAATATKFSPKAAAPAAVISGAAVVVAKKNAAKNKATGGGGGGGGGSTGGDSGGGGAPAGPAVDTSNLIQWGDIAFYAKPSGIRTYKGLTLKSSTTTETEENGDDAYIKKKKNGAYEISLTAILDKRLGEGDVLSSARHILECCRSGYTGYIYCRGAKLVSSQMMGVSANINNVLQSPNGSWISCEIQISLKQSSKLEGDCGASPQASSDGSGGGGDGSGGKKTYTATVYYSASSGARQSVTATSTVSQKDADNKAYAKIPKNAQWASKKNEQAINQTNAKATAKSVSSNAKSTTSSKSSTTKAVTKVKDAVKKTKK